MSASRSEQAADLDSVMDEAFSPELKNRLVFVDVWVDPHEHVYPMAIKGRLHAGHVSFQDHHQHPGRLHVMRHIITVLLENEPGALSRVVGLFAQRNYNIESLTVAPTEDADPVPAHTHHHAGDDSKIEQIMKHLYKVVEVVKVVDLSEADHVERELMLIKIRAEGECTRGSKTDGGYFSWSDRRCDSERLHRAAVRTERQARRLHSRHRQAGRFWRWHVPVFPESAGARRSSASSVSVANAGTQCRVTHTNEQTNTAFKR